MHIMDELRNMVNEEIKHNIKIDDYMYGFVPVSLKMDQSERTSILKHFPSPKLPKPENTVNIKDLNKGDMVNHYMVLVNEVNLKKTSTKKPFLQLKLFNKHGQISAKMWDNGKLNTYKEKFENNPVCMVKGQIDEFRNNKSLTVQEFIPVKGTFNPLKLFPSTSFNFDELTTELFYYINRIDDPFKEIVYQAMTLYWKSFSIVPAAKGHHHSYLGGLLQHTVEMVRIIWNLTHLTDETGAKLLRLFTNIQKENLKNEFKNLLEDEEYNSRNDAWNDFFDHSKRFILKFIETNRIKPINKSLLIAAAVFHDIGKIFDYTYAGDTNKMRFLFDFASDVDVYDDHYANHVSGITMDEQGSLMGHMMTGQIMFYNIISQNNIPIKVEEITEFLHLIESHHGKLDYGSSVTPRCSTAFLLHLVDNLSAKYEKEISS